MKQFAVRRIRLGAPVPAALLQRHSRGLLVCLGVLFVGFAALTWLHRFTLAYTTGNGTFLAGPDFVTARLTIPVFTWVHITLLLIAALSTWWLAFGKHALVVERDGFAVVSVSRVKPLFYAGGGYLLSMVVTGVVGALVNALYVHPNQSTVELPYIQRSIDATRWALGIDHVAVKPFNPATTLTASAVQADTPTLNNARVNDQGQTTTIYNQLQSFKNYFQFTPAEVDRYQQDEVYISAREMDVDKLPVQTWVNRTLVYTHGYGIAASPVNRFDADGLPLLWAKDTPQTTQAPIPAITRPEIYFGMMQNDVIAPSKQGEFDYPAGAADHTSHYQGGYGLPVNGNRWLLALEEKSLKFFTSDQITAQSQYLFDRDIYDRVKDIAPFLVYDSDAFPFIDSQGHIQWMLDAFTETSNIPYAQTYMNTNYVRNSVKVVVDAYTGKTTFYVVDPSDPMIQSLMRVYPKLFTTQIPDDVRAHFRYPMDLFQVQATALASYHMTDPAAFYNQEDLWDLAEQVYNQNETAPRPPVYQMLRMPDRTQLNFVLSALFTPHQKMNLNGWLIADNDPGSYGQLTLYQFPQSSLIFGPMQAENQIDSNPTVSSQLTLWNQQGSHVVRGDLLMIPLGNTVLYVEPIYIVASREGSLPQLQRVIVDYNKQVYMDDSLGAAIQDLLGSGSNGAEPLPNTPAGGAGGATPSAGTGATETVAQLSDQANQWFQKYESDTAKGDFEAAGADLKQLGQVLQQLQKASKTG
ncbi:hypothetical protein GCM10025857_19430 [Alicyclobacillus contaminans]|nr:hypothetical protein GCM10025857_19430 [Alicyclobacillus contaminans]